MGTKVVNITCENMTRMIRTSELEDILEEHSCELVDSSHIVGPNVRIDCELESVTVIRAGGYEL